MTTWIMTGLLALIIVMIIYAEVRHGRRTKHFLAEISPEIKALNDSVMRKYREKYGKDPTMPFHIVDAGKK